MDCGRLVGVPVWSVFAKMKCFCCLVSLICQVFPHFLMMFLALWVFGVSVSVVMVLVLASAWGKWVEDFG